VLGRVALNTRVAVIRRFTCDRFDATVGFLVAAFGEEEVTAVMSEWHRGHRSG